MNRATPLGDSSFVGALRDSDIGKKIFDAAERARTARRKELADQLAARTASNAKAWPRLVEAEAEAIKAVRAAEAALAVERDKLHAANLARHNEAADYTATRADLEAELLKTASPKIFEFIAWAREDIEASRRAFAFMSRAFRNPVTLRQDVETVNNRDSILRRIAALNDGIDAAHDLALRADQSSVEEEIAKIRAALPKITQPEFQEKSR